MSRGNWRSVGDVLREVVPALKLRRTCSSCGGTRQRAFWFEAQRQHVIGRCLDCGANFHGAGVWLPKGWADQSVRGLSVDVDPHATCEHGQGPHPAQGDLGLTADVCAESDR